MGVKKLVIIAGGYLTKKVKALLINLFHFFALTKKVDCLAKRDRNNDQLDLKVFCDIDFLAISVFAGENPGANILAQYLDETLKKVVLHSVATALANMVLPVPGIMLKMSHFSNGNVIVV